MQPQAAVFGPRRGDEGLMLRLPAVSQGPPKRKVVNVVVCNEDQHNQLGAQAPGVFVVKGQLVDLPGAGHAKRRGRDVQMGQLPGRKFLQPDLGLVGNGDMPRFNEGVAESRRCGSLPRPARSLAARGPGSPGCWCARRSRSRGRWSSGLPHWAASEGPPRERRPWANASARTGSLHGAKLPRPARPKPVPPRGRLRSRRPSAGRDAASGRPIAHPIVHPRAGDPSPIILVDAGRAASPILPTPAVDPL